MIKLEQLKVNKKNLEKQLAELTLLEKKREQFIKEKEPLREQISRVKGAIQYVNQLIESSK
jgi:hypothetical protein